MTVADVDRDALELVRGAASAPRLLGLPPGSLPLEVLRSMVRRYRAGRGTDSGLIAAVDRHGDALEIEIGRHACARLDEYMGLVDRLEAVHRRLADLRGQEAWLRAWPASDDAQPVALWIEFGGRRYAMSSVLAALRASGLECRLARPGVRARPRRRGASPSMAALAESGKTTGDVALAAGRDRTSVWRILTGAQPATAEFWRDLERLIGPEQAGLVRDGVPVQPRARAQAGRAVRALNAAGITSEELAAVVPATPGTVRRWLRGTLRAPSGLAAALEQLVDPKTAAQIVSLIPVVERH